MPHNRRFTHTQIGHDSRNGNGVKVIRLGTITLRSRYACGRNITRTINLERFSHLACHHLSTCEDLSSISSTSLQHLSSISISSEDQDQYGISSASRTAPPVNIVFCAVPVYFLKDMKDQALPHLPLQVVQHEKVLSSFPSYSWEALLRGAV